MPDANRALFPAQEWGVPDWTDKGAYSLAGLSPMAWAWEFLRRNHDYRRDYRGSADVDTLARAEEGIDFAIDADDSIDGGGILCKKFSILSNETRRMRMAQRYGILFAHEPTRTDRYPIFNENCVSELRGNVHLGALKIGEIGYIFDLQRPLKHQFALALRAAKTLQLQRIKQLQIGELPANTKIRDDLYPSYLRILDAEDAGARPIEIRKVLFPQQVEAGERHGFNQQRKQAHYLRDEGYLRLAADDFQPRAKRSK